MGGLAAGLFLSGSVGIQIHTKRNAQFGTGIGVALPVIIVLGVFALAVPLAADAAAKDGKVDAGILGFLPVDLPLIFGDVDSLQRGGQDRLPGAVEVISGVILHPGARTGPRLRDGRLPFRALRHQKQNQAEYHNDKQGQPRQDQPLSGLVFGFAFVSYRRLLHVGNSFPQEVAGRRPAGPSQAGHNVFVCGTARMDTAGTIYLFIWYHFVE